MLRLVAAAALLAAAACAPPVLLEHQAPPTLHLEPGGYELAEVIRIVDGDTITVMVVDRMDGPGAGDAAIGAEHDVRLLGIDTPESVDPRRPVECFGEAASAATAALLEGKDVVMVKDVEEVDQYDRLLRYIYFGGEMANARLVVNGYAHAYTYPPNVRHSRMLVGLERAAREAERGLWSSETCDGEA